MHTAFDEVCAKARLYDTEVTGSELVGLVPFEIMRKAGISAIRKQKGIADCSNSKLINAAIDYLGLNVLTPFDPHRKIIEYALERHKSILGEI
jgi:glutamate formiminotransferase/formiminotetrahydrofolate cyclodeaminase